MIIAEVCFSSAWGGLEHYCADSIRRLAIGGHDVLPVVRAGSPLEEKLRSEGLSPVTLHPLDYFSPLSTLRLARLFKKHTISAVHLHRTQDLGTALLASDLAGVPNRVLTLQMESHRRKGDPYHRWVYGRLTRVLTITERMRKLVIDRVAVNSGKVRCLYYGVDVAQLRSEAEPGHEIRRRWNISPEAFVVGIVGRLERLKGQEVLFKAAEYLKGRIPGLTVMIVGDETVGQAGETYRLKRIAVELTPDVKVVFTGYQSPPGGIVPAFDVSVLASRKETFGLVVIEAQALGVPVVATDAGGVPEIIEDGVNGLLVAPDDPEAMAEALERLYREPELRSRIGEAGSRNVETRFSMDAHMEGLVRALEGE